MDNMLRKHNAPPDAGGSADAHPDTQRTSVAAWVAASMAFSRQPLRERQVVPAQGGGYTYSVRPLQTERAEDVAQPSPGFAR